MPIPTPFHPRTSALCTSLRFKDWAGYYAVCSYGTCHEREYYAIRHAAGLIDVTPLYKYEVCGSDAAAFLSRVMVRNVCKLKVYQVAYTCWCDDSGHVVDDGTVSRLTESHYRVTSAEPALAWLMRWSRGYDVTIEDSTQRLAALSLQGPNARDILKQVCGVELAALKFFRLMRSRIDGFAVTVTRTGYTGDLGYEIWVDHEYAVALWDAFLSSGKPFGIQPAGLDAMDVTRVEAGFILNGVDYFSAPRCLIDSRKSTPFELALGWMVHLDRDPFNGQAALRAEKQSGPRRTFVGLDVDWEELERRYAEHALPPEVPANAWRTPVPVYHQSGKQVGQATSGSWSPILKKNLALATVATEYSEVGTELRIEVTVEFQRRTVKATVAKKPFFDPARKKA